MAGLWLLPTSSGKVKEDLGKKKGLVMVLGGIPNQEMGQVLSLNLLCYLGPHLTNSDIITLRSIICNSAKLACLTLHAGRYIHLTLQFS